MRGIALIVELFLAGSFLLTIITLPSFADNLVNYYSLVERVHSHFGTSCVFVVYSKQDSLFEIRRIGNTIQQLSHRSIKALMVEYRELNRTMQFYSKRVVRALVAFILRTNSMVDIFAKMTKDFNMGGPCWLLIFNDEVYRKYYPHKPGTNIFHLTFNTEMLVIRTDHNIIQEWYWLRNRVKIQDLATWDYDTGFTLRTNDSLYVRRNDLEKTTLLVTTFNNPPLTIYENNTIGGFFGTILLELSRAANFQIEFVLPKENLYGSWIPEENRWTGLIDMLVSGKANLAVAEFSITRPRMESVDFTLPIISTHDKLYIREPTRDGIHWSSYWQVFTPGIWIAIQTLILLATILLTLITIVRQSRITVDLVSSYLLLVFGVYCQQGLPVFPTDLPSQITFFSVFLSAIVVLAAYSASLISYLTVTSVSLPFYTVEGFTADGTYDLIVFRDGAEYDMFASATEGNMVKMRDLMKRRRFLPATVVEGFEQVCSGKVAFYLPAALQETYSSQLPCKVVGIDTKRSMTLAMALSKNNPYYGLINYHVQRFRDHGILDRLKKTYALSSQPVTTSTHSEVKIWGVMPILVILGGGILLALVILCLESIYFMVKARRSRERKKRYNQSASSYGENQEIWRNALRDRPRDLSTSWNFRPQRN